MVDIYKEKFELLALTETKLKGNGEVSWCGVNDIIAGVQEMGGHPVERCGAQGSDRRCVSFRILWIKFKFSRLMVCAVVGYDPNEGDGEEREVLK